MLMRVITTVVLLRWILMNIGIFVLGVENVDIEFEIDAGTAVNNNALNFLRKI